MFLDSHMKHLLTKNLFIKKFDNKEYLSPFYVFLEVLMLFLFFASPPFLSPDCKLVTCTVFVVSSRSFVLQQIWNKYKVTTKMIISSNIMK